MPNGYEPQEVIKAILNWAKLDENDDFDTSFVEDLEEAYEKYEELTPKQVQALENILNRFDIDVSEHA